MSSVLHYENIFVAGRQGQGRSFSTTVFLQAASYYLRFLHLLQPLEEFLIPPVRNKPAHKDSSNRAEAKGTVAQSNGVSLALLWCANSPLIKADNQKRARINSKCTFLLILLMSDKADTHQCVTHLPLT